MNTPDAAVCTFSNLAEGYHSVKLHVTDNRGGTDEDQVNITVLPAVPASNKPPTIDIEADTLMQEPQDSTYLTSKVADPDGQVVSILWIQTGGREADIFSSQTAETWVNNLGLGVNEFELIVVDNSGAIVTKRVRVIVTRPQNK